MAELVGGALLSGFLNVLFDRLASREFVDFFRGKKVISMAEQRELKRMIRSAAGPLREAELLQFKKPEVKEWLDDLKDLIYEVDHVIDKINTEILQRKIEGGEASTSFSDDVVKSNIEDTLKRLKDLLSEDHGLKPDTGYEYAQAHRIIAPAIEESDAFGRVDEKKVIVDHLLFCGDVDGASKVSVIPIVGMGGIGKTTLAQLVYKDKIVNEHFELKAWVTVTEEFDVLRITREVSTRVIGKKYDHTGLYQLQEELKMALSGKKFLFVLDDVWNEDYKSLESLVNPFGSGAHGSKIIVTTRSKNVASKIGTVNYHNLSIMKDDDCWELFKKHAFVNANNIGQLEEIGKEIVKKCKGLPLAVKSIAGLLRTSSDIGYWESIRDSNVWESQFQEDQRNEIPPALWLSYHSLPAQIKRCFVYCSIFPKDYEFDVADREKIVLLWMAEGLLQPQKNKTIEDVGNEYLNYLISNSFFQVVQRDHLLMHNLIHDLAIRMSGEFCILSNNYNFDNDITRKTIHLSYTRDFICTMESMGLDRAKNFRTILALPSIFRYILISKGWMEEVAVDVIMRSGVYLRVLSLFGYDIEKIPDSIGNLKYLRYLDLSNTEIEEVPISVCTLYNLQTLLLLYCFKLKYLPNDIHRLINLRHLNIKGTPLREMPSGFDKLSNLQTLSDYVVSENNGSRIKELGDLQLHGHLCISGLENVSDVENAIKANLKSKVNLKSLELEGKGESEDSVKEYEVLSAFQPNTNLEKLIIFGFGGTKFPDWVVHQSFGVLVEISVSECLNCYSLPPFGQLPSLKILCIEIMPNVVSVGDEFCGTNHVQSFPSLEELIIDDMSSWEKWSFTETKQTATIFPRLKTLHIQYCRKLKVGLDAQNHFQHLENVTIRSCDSMVRVFPKSECPRLKSIWLRDCGSLESFSDNGWPICLEVLTIMDCKRLISKRMHWNLQRISSLQIVVLWDVDVEMFPEECLLPSTLTRLEIVSFDAKGLNGKALQHLTSLRQLYISDCSKLECLPDEGLPTSLTHLRIYFCPLLKKRCQRGIGEDWPKIQHIPNISIEEFPLI